MTPVTAATPSPEPDPEASAVALRSSTELQTVPAERAPAALKRAVSVPPPQVPVPGADLPLTLETLARYETALPAAMALPRRIVATPPPEITWGLASLALAAGVGWIYERRRRMALEVEVEGEGAHRATAPAARRRVPTAGVDETFPEDGEVTEATRPVYVSVIGDTPSRREATLVDLHSLDARLQSLRRNHIGATELLEQHLVDFRYTSPWVFLELRELYQRMDQREEWELVRDAFRSRFGQNAPQWNSPSTASEEIADDQQLCSDLVRKWPQRDARLFVLRWMLGDATSRQKSSGPPQLALGIYRDMLLLDSLLDEVMVAARPAPPVLVKA